MKRSLEKAAAVAAGAVLLAGCESIEDTQPVDQAQDTVYVTYQPEIVAEVQYEASFVAGEPVTANVYRLMASANERENTTNAEIAEELGSAAMYMAYDTDGHFSIVPGGIGDIVLEPSGRQEGTNEECYTVKDIYKAAKMGGAKIDSVNHETVTQIIANEIDACRKGKLGSDNLTYGSAAFSKADVNYYGIRKDGTGQIIGTYFEYGTILHELGHNLGLGHYPDISCEKPELNAEAIMPDDNPLLRDISKITEDEKCGPEVTDDGTIKHYVNSSSVMGRGHKDEDSKLNYLTPAYSNLDRATVLPDTYIIQPIDTEPAVYELEYGEDMMNGLEIRLADNHPLQKIDERITKLIIINEATNGSKNEKDDKFQEKRNCKVNVNCNPIIVVSNDDYSVRYAMDKPIHQIILSNDLGNSKKVLYMDQSMNFGVVLYKRIGDNPIIEIVDYQTVTEIADLQQKTYEAYNDTMRSESSNPEH